MIYAVSFTLNGIISVFWRIIFISRVETLMYHLVTNDNLNASIPRKLLCGCIPKSSSIKSMSIYMKHTQMSWPKVNRENYWKKVRTKGHTGQYKAFSGKTLLEQLVHEKINNISRTNMESGSIHSV